jgi:hypothetical protein
MTTPFNPPNNVATGGAGSNAVGFGNGFGMVTIQDPPRNRPFPCPYPESAFQAGSGSGGATMGAVQVPIPPRPGIRYPAGPYSYQQQSVGASSVCMG